MRICHKLGEICENCDARRKPGEGDDKCNSPRKNWGLSRQTFWPTLSSLDWEEWLKIKNVTPLLCEALPHCQICHFLVLSVVKNESSVLTCNNFSNKKDGTVFIAAPFWDSGWWGGCYFDRNILPVLALTALVAEFVWICCHVVSFCSNYTRLIGQGKSLYKPLCQWLADKGCSGITSVKKKNKKRWSNSFAWAVTLQEKIMDTHSLCVSWERFNKSSYTPDFQH